MIRDDIRQTLQEIAPDAILFDNPSFDNSIIGLSTEGGVVYDLEQMAEELAAEDQIPLDEAYEFIDYNTLRSLGYMNLEGIAPTVVDRNQPWSD